MILVNDLHIGVQRKGGTTPASREALRNYLLNSIQETLVKSDEDWLVINGDLFDEFEVDLRDWLATYNILCGWLNRGRKLTLVAGNHDHSPKALRVSSFETLCSVLQSQYVKLVQVCAIDRSAALGNQHVIALAHCSNQDIFDAKLAELTEHFDRLSGVEPGFLLLHANYANNFAAQSDHSLNVSEQQAKTLVDAGVTLIFAHEHQARTALKGGVVVLGNQYPTSIVDCLGNDDKFAYTLDSRGISACEKTWTRSSFGRGGFAEIDWRELGDTNADFIRVVGEASSAEASEVINAIARYRLKSEAFVITNAVKIEGIREAESLPETFEVARTFDVMDFIAQHLDAAEMAVVKELVA